MKFKRLFLYFFFKKLCFYVEDSTLFFLKNLSLQELDDLSVKKPDFQLSSQEESSLKFLIILLLNDTTRIMLKPLMNLDFFSILISGFVLL